MFYSYKELYDQSGEEVLFEMSRKNPCLKNRVTANVENAVININTPNGIPFASTAMCIFVLSPLSNDPFLVVCLWHLLHVGVPLHGLRQLLSIRNLVHQLISPISLYHSIFIKCLLFFAFPPQDPGLYLEKSKRNT
jgi:hypothetical protein